MACPAVPPSSAISATFALRHLPKASVSGAFEPVPSSFILVNAGDSASCSRIQIETPRSRIETRNGTRQPQSAKASGVMVRRSARMTSSDRNRPTVAVVWIQEV